MEAYILASKSGECRFGMPVYYVTPYFLKPEKAAAFREWLGSEKAKELIKDYEEETGIKYVGTFFSVLGFGTYDAEDWWEMKDYAAFDRLRESKVQEKVFDEVLPFIDLTHTVPSRLYRSASDVRIYFPKTKKEK